MRVEQTGRYCRRRERERERERGRGRRRGRGQKEGHLYTLKLRPWSD